MNRRAFLQTSTAAASLSLLGGCALPVAQTASKTLAVTQPNASGMISYGQSLSIGSAGQTPLTTSQPYVNQMLASGIVGGDGTSNGAYSSLIALVEGGTPDFAQITGTEPPLETGWAAMANFLSQLGMQSGSVLRFIVSAAGQGGQPTSNLVSGTSNFARFVDQLTAQKSLAVAAGMTYQVPAIPFVHGEADEGNANYESDIIRLQAQLQAAIQAVTGQAGVVPFVLSQTSGFISSPLSALGALQASIDYPATFICIGPKYQYSYVAGSQHLTNYSYRANGLQSAKFTWRMLTGQSTKPVYPRSTQRTGNQILVQFWTGYQLVFDSVGVSDPGIAGGLLGFEYYDNSGAIPAITAATVVSLDTVLIVLAAAPTGSGNLIRYAYTVPPTGGGSTGNGNKARGCLRDSDPTVAPYNDVSGSPYALYNWCSHFSVPC